MPPTFDLATAAVAEAIVELPTLRVAELLAIASFVLAVRGDETPRSVLETAFGHAVTDENWRSMHSKPWKDLDAAAGGDR